MQNRAQDPGRFVSEDKALRTQEDERQIAGSRKRRCNLTAPLVGADSIEPRLPGRPLKGPFMAPSVQGIFANTAAAPLKFATRTVTGETPADETESEMEQ